MKHFDLKKKKNAIHMLFVVNWTIAQHAYEQHLYIFPFKINK